MVGINNGGYTGGFSVELFGSFVVDMQEAKWFEEKGIKYL